MSERQASQKTSPSAKDGAAASSEPDPAAGARAVNLDYGSIGATTKKSDEPTLVVVVGGDTSPVQEKAVETQAKPGIAVSKDDPLLDCLTMLTAIHGNPMSTEALKAGLPLSDNTLSPALFIRAAERAGLSARVVKRSLRDISPLTLPCVLLLEERKACLLVKFVGKDKAEVVFPETGKGVTRVSIDDLAKIYTGNVLFTRPEYQFDARTDTLAKPRMRAWFWGTIASSWRIYIEVELAAFLVNLFALASPLFIMNVYDRVVPNNAIETLWVLALGVATVFGFDFTLRTLRAWVVERMLDLLMILIIFGVALTRVAHSTIRSTPRIEAILKAGGAAAGVTGLVCLALLFALRQFRGEVQRRLLDGLAFLPEALLGSRRDVFGGIWRRDAVHSQHLLHASAGALHGSRMGTDRRLLLLCVPGVPGDGGSGSHR